MFQNIDVYSILSIFRDHMHIQTLNKFKKFTALHIFMLLLFLT